METPKRLQPSLDTLRRLYSLSGNQCAFPGCCHPMFNNEGNFVGQICHIEAALPGGERFNPNMSNEARRSFGNLMLMCYDHHIETNKEQVYPVSRLQDIKRQHEEIYSNIDRFVHQMQSTITDVTSGIVVGKVSSLRALYIEVFGEDFREPEHVDEEVTAFNSAIDKLASLSPDAKQIFAISLSRAKYELNFLGRETENIYVDPYEIERVTQLAPNYLHSIFQEIERSGILSFDNLDDGQAVYRIVFQGCESNIWDMIRLFCIKKNLNISQMVSGLNFAAID